MICSSNLLGAKVTFKTTGNTTTQHVAGKTGYIAVVESVPLQGNTQFALLVLGPDGSLISCGASEVTLAQEFFPTGVPSTLGNAAPAVAPPMPTPPPSIDKLHL